VNRLFRRIRRGRKGNRLSKILELQRQQRRGHLALEPLEGRLLLTTLILSEGATGTTDFYYADAQENSTGSDVSVFNEIRIGTLSGEPPEKDIVVEILDYRGFDIGGIYSENGGEAVSLYGGPSGGQIISQVPENTTGKLYEGQTGNIYALATNSAGETYGIGINGYLVKIDTETGGIRTDIGYVRDTDSQTTTINYENFQAATFAKDANGNDVLYAVVTGPTEFDVLGNPDFETYASILITIDPTSGEADPVGKRNGNPYYESSIVQIAGQNTDITTIVFSEEGQNQSEMTDEPIFIGFDDISNTFVTIGVDQSDIGNNISVVAQTASDVDTEEAVIQGLMYDSQGRLFGLYDEGVSNGDVNDGKLVLVQLYAAPDDHFIDVVEYGDNSNEGNIWLAGMSYDTQNRVGYATDPLSGTLYQLNVNNLEEDENGNLVNQGLADVCLVYIAQSTADTYITFTRFEFEDDGNRVYTPTEGEGAYLFTDDDDSDIYTPAEAGGVMIGVIPQNLDDDDDIEWSAGGAGTFFNSDFTAPVGYLGASDPSIPDVTGAYPGGRFRPGIVLADDEEGNPQFIGKIQVGGCVFGDVMISGGIDTFYAGYLATNNFVVEGDLNNLIVSTQAGGIEESDGSWTSVGSTKYWGDGMDPVVDIYGRMGSFYSKDDWGMNIRVRGRGDLPDFPGVLDIDSGLYVQTQREMERKTRRTDVDIVWGSYFAWGSLDNTDEYIIVNDTPYEAQYLGTLDGKMSVTGYLELGSEWDSEDYYSFGLLAGETVEILLYNTGGSTNFYTGHPADPDSLDIWERGWIDLLDPDLNWVGNNGEYDIVTGTPAPLRFTAEEAGIYTVAVNGISGNTKWVGVPYRLEITGVSETTLGGGNVLTDMRKESYYINGMPNIQVVNGRLGAVSVGNYLREGIIEVLNGDMGALRAGANDLDPNHLNIRYEEWDNDIAAPGAGELGFGYEITDAETNWNEYGHIYVSGNVGLISSLQKSILDITVGGDLQSLRIGGELLAGEPGLAPVTTTSGDELDDTFSFVGMIAVDGNIGEIRVEGNYTNKMKPELNDAYWDYAQSGIFANADGVGDPGVIDVIMIGGDLNAPVSVGARGGNVRFADIGGGIIHSSGGWASGDGLGPFVFLPGQGVTITDDSGALVHISPGFLGEEEEATVTPTTIDDQQQQTPEEPAAEPGVLTIKLLPVLDITADQWYGNINRTELGYAIVSIDSTDGLRVSSTGGPVEIGRITCDGVEDGTVVLAGSYPISVMNISVPGPSVQTTTDTQTTGEDYVRIGVAQVVNKSGYWEHLFNGRWVTGPGLYQRWVGGDILSLRIGISDEQGPASTSTYPLPQDYAVNLIKVQGDLGLTENTTGQVLKSRRMVEDALDHETDPGGEQFNGLYSEASIYVLSVAGALGDVDVVEKNVFSIVINDDKSRAIDQYDGVVGAVQIGGDLFRIDLGDGIPAPGSGYTAKSGIFVTGELGTVVIDGAGRDIGGPLFVTGGITKIEVKNGARIIGYNGQGGTGERVRGSFGMCQTINITDSFNTFFLEENSSTVTGSIGTISVTGIDSEINGALIMASGIGSLKVTGGANGIFDSRIYARGTVTSTGTITEIYVGGEGIHNTLIQMSKELGRLTIAPGGTLEDSEIRGEYHVGTITVPEISRTDIDAINKLDRISVNGNIFDLAIEAGELGYLQATEILGSAIFVAGPVAQIQTREDLISTIVLTGPRSDLKYMMVGGNFGTPTGGLLSVDGKVGMIFVSGDFQAEMQLNWQEASPQYPEGYQKYDYSGNELNYLMVGGRMIGFGDIGGDVGTISTRGDLGTLGSELHVHGDLQGLQLIGIGQSANLRSDLTVDGNLGSVMVFGSVLGDITVEDNFGSLLLLGRGSVRANLVGDVTVGGNFGRLIIINGDQLGDMTVEGTGPMTIIRGSDIEGTTIVGGGPGFTIDGSITSTGRYFSTGSVTSLHIKGDIEEGGVLYVDGDLDQLIVDGSIEGLVHVTGSIGQLQTANMGLVEGGIAPTVTAAGDIDVVNISQRIEDGYVLAGFDPGVGSIIAGILDGSISEIDMAQPQNIIALYEELSVDGTAIDPNESALTGNIQSVKVNLLYNSVIAAGVSPGSNAIFGDLDGSDSAGPGLSSIGSVNIGAVLDKDNPFGIFADTAIKSLIVGGAYIPTPVMQSGGFHAWTMASIGHGDIDGFLFESGRTFQIRLQDSDGKEVRVLAMMVGAGMGQILPREDGTGIEAIQLMNTTSQTTVQILAIGAGTLEVDQLFNGDDENLNMLMVNGVITDGNGEGILDIGGSINTMMLGGIGTNTEAKIGGNVRMANMGVVNGPSTITIEGTVNQFRAETISSEVTVSAGNIDNLFVMGDMDGQLLSEGAKLTSATIMGDMDGVLSSAGDIDRVRVNGTLSGGIRAAGNLGTFMAGKMFTGTAAAGGNFGLAQVMGDVKFSTLAAGLDIGPSGNIYNLDDVISGRGDLGRVLILGNFVESNMAAGVGPGEDNMFGTGDDPLQVRAADDVAAPQVIGVSLDYTSGGNDFDAINVQFRTFSQGRSSNIGTVQIFGNISGSDNQNEQFAIVSAGAIGSVIARQQVFSGIDNVVRMTVNSKDVQASSIEGDIESLTDALNGSFIIQTDGPDHQFASLNDIWAGAVDDTVIFGGDVWVEFNPDTNTASFHKSSGFLNEAAGTNYYKIILDAEQVENRQGILLDGEYAGKWPSGDGIPGNGNFEYVFAVGDIGGSDAVAFTPFENNFPANVNWIYESNLGTDNLQVYGANVALDNDVYRLNGLEKGQILNIDLKNLATSAGLNNLWFNRYNMYLQVAQIRPSNLIDESGAYVQKYLGRDDLDPARDLVVPNLDELAYSQDTFFGYDGQGQQFYNIDRIDLSLTLLENDLDTLNALPEVVMVGGNIEQLWGLTGHAGDSLWAIAEFSEDGHIRESLVLIENIAGTSGMEPRVKIADYDLSNDFTDITTLAQFEGEVYGIDNASNTLVKIGSDPEAANYGVPTAVDGEPGNLGNEDLHFVGLDISPDGQSLLGLHDQSGLDFNTLLTDGLYKIDPATGQAELWQEFYSSNPERGGIAVVPDGVILMSLPLRSSPIGDTVNISANNETVEHVFGGSDPAEIGGGLYATVYSDPNYVNPISGDTLLENALQQEFIDGGFYYAFEVEYNTLLDNVSVLISDIDWLNELEFGDIISVITDDPNVVTTSVGREFNFDTLEYEQYIQLDISARDGDGNVKVYFAGTSAVIEVGAADLELGGKVLGENTRQDLDVTRDMILPNLDELTIASKTLATRMTVDLTDELIDILTEDLVARLDYEVTSDETGEVYDELNGLSNMTQLINDYKDGLTTFEYDTVGYDSQQEMFALISSDLYDAMPINVTDPNNTLHEVPLTLDVLTAIYQQMVDSTITFEDIRGLEFGREVTETGNIEFWATVSYTRLIDSGTGLTASHDGLLKIGNILNPAGDSIVLSVNDLEDEGFSHVTELAYGLMPGSDPDNGTLYGYDSDTQSLITFDSNVWVRNSSGTLELNPNFGKAIPLGGPEEIGNLARSSSQSIDIVAMDFDMQGRLLAVEDNLHALVEISTDTIGLADQDRLDLVQILPSENVYQTLSFDSSGHTSKGFLVLNVDGSPINDEMTVSAEVAGDVFQGSAPHIFGSASPTTINTDNGSITISSAWGNTSSEVASEGGFYRFQVDYTTGQGEMLLTINNIDWIGGQGNLDSVFTSDEAEINVSVANVGNDSLTLQIDSGIYAGGQRSVTVYMGSTSDLEIPGTVQYATELITALVNSSPDGSIDVSIQLPEDGDYLIDISSYYNSGESIDYMLNVMLFDDGNGDFGISQTPSGFVYDQIVPNNQPVDLMPGSPDLIQDTYYPNLYTTSNQDWPSTISGTLLSPGQAGEVVIDSELAMLLDHDIYTFQLQEGQSILIDLDAETLFGRDDVEVIVGIYNGDLESITTIGSGKESEDVASSEAVDPTYEAQAIHTMPNHQSVIIDPTDGEGMMTYYVVVNGYSYGVENLYSVLWNEEIPYRLTISTTEAEPIETPPSQLVWLSFGDARTGENAQADYLIEAGAGQWPESVAERPAFDTSDFNIPEYMRDDLIEAIAARIEDIYRDAGLSTAEIEFTTEEPSGGSVYSTVVIGGRLPEIGLVGLAETVDRGNSDHTDMAVVLSEEIGLFYLVGGLDGYGPLSDDPQVRFDQVVTLVSNTTAHELGHILGLEHATEVLTDEPNNLMGYNDDLVLQELEQRNAYWYQDGLGFTNEIDMLLRVIGAGTVMGA